MADSQEKLGLINSIILFVNSLAVFALFGCYLARYISPDSFWPFAFLGISYPILLLVNLIFIVWWIVCRKRHYTLSLITVLLGWNSFFSFYQFSGNDLPENAENTLKIISYNTHYFDYFDYKMGKKDDSNKDSILSFFNKENPDIICIQEYVRPKAEKEKFKTREPIRNKLGLKYYYFNHTSDHYDRVAYTGISVFSRFPIINFKDLEFERLSTDNDGFYVDILAFKDTIRVFNLHLESIRLGYSDQEFYEDMTENRTKTHEIKEGSRKIISKLKRAFILRARQAKFVDSIIRISPHPVIVCGDFNDTPTSFAYHKVKGDLKDAFVESGSGIGNTYNGKVPSFRIDYILHSNAFNAFGFRREKVTYSDHYPIVTTLVYNKKSD